MIREDLHNIVTRQNVWDAYLVSFPSKKSLNFLVLVIF